MAETPSSRRLDSLTGLRFFAAFAVILSHQSFLGHVLGARWWQFGYLGVPFFFALSGFVLAWTHRDDDTPRAFWRRRIARVYPLYLATLIPGVVIALTGHAHVPLSRPVADVTVVSVVLYVVCLQAWVPTEWAINQSANGPGWSISVEAFFYALFPLLAVRIRGLGERTIVCWVAVILVAQAAAIAIANYAIHGAALPFVTYNSPLFGVASFIGGMLMATAVRRGVRFPPLWASTAGTVLFVFACGALSTNPTLRSYLHASGDVELGALPFVFLLLGSAARADLRGGGSPFRHRRVVALGVWSYALYLIQYPLIMITRAIWPRGFSTSTAVASIEAVIFIGAAIAVAFVAHRWIELPWNERLRHAPPSLIERQEEIALPRDQQRRRERHSAESDLPY